MRRGLQIAAAVVVVSAIGGAITTLLGGRVYDWEVLSWMFTAATLAITLIFVAELIDP